MYLNTRKKKLKKMTQKNMAGYITYGEERKRQENSRENCRDKTRKAQIEDIQGINENF